MKIIDACGAKLQVEYIREALRDLPLDAIARTSPAQEAAWENLGLRVGEIDPKKLLNFSPPTMGGRRIIVDAWFLPDRIRFEVDGKPVVGIVNLAVPE